MRRLSALVTFAFMIWLMGSMGCATTRSKAPSVVCPDPPQEEKQEFISVADTIPLLHDESTLCLVWRSNEEHGRILRVVTRTKTGFSVDLKRMSDEEREEFRQLAADAIRQTPAFKGRTLWQICGEKNGVKV